MINPLIAGFLQSTIMSTCAWTATTLPLRKGQGTTQYFTQLFLSLHLINPQRRSGSRDHLGWGWRILCHQLSASLSGPDQEIPGKDVTQISYYIIYHQVAVPDDYFILQIIHSILSSHGITRASPRNLQSWKSLAQSSS